MAENLTPNPPAVLAEIRAGDHLPLNALARRQRVNPATVFRWVTKGVRGPAGRVYLEAVRIGSRWVTSDAAFARFVAATTPSRAPVPPAPPPSPSARHAAGEAAGRQLDAAGW